MTLWPGPDPKRTFHFLGDTHFIPGGVMTASRTDVLTKDIISRRNIVPLGHMIVGDLANEDTGLDASTAAGDTAAQTFMAAVQAGTGATFHVGCPGNHDTVGRTSAAWATAYGLSAVNRVITVSNARTPFRIIIVGHDQLQGGGTNRARIALSAATLTWLGARLAEATDRPALIVAHAPLKNTMLADNVSDFDSATADFWICSEAVSASDTDIRTVLAASPNDRLAWISGHTHPEPAGLNDGIVDIVKAETVGSNVVAAVNCPAPAYNGVSAQGYDQMFGTYLSVFEDRIEVRFRNHSAGCWDAVFTNQLDGVTGPKLVHSVTW